MDSACCLLKETVSLSRCNMPIYEYKCSACGHRFEELQKFSDAPLVECPVCHKPALKKQITEAGFVLKGTGWYQTDFKNEGSKPSSSGSHTAGCSCKACSANSKN